MNYARLPASHADVRMPTLRPALPRRLLAAVKRFCFSLEDSPVYIGSAIDPPGRGLAWLVTATLSRQAAFGAVSVQSTCWVAAATRTEALAEALSHLAKSHPGYSCAMIRADASPAG